MKKFISMVMAAAMVVSLVPATAFAMDGEVTAVAKVIKAKDFAEADDDFMIQEADAPELRIKVTESDWKETVNTDSAAEIKITLDNAEWGKEKITEAEFEALVTMYCDKLEVSESNVANAITEFEVNDDNDEIEFVFTHYNAKGEPCGYHEDDALYIDLATLLTKTKVGAEATVSVKSSDLNLDAKDMVFASIVDKAIDVEIEDTVDVAPEEIVELEDLTIEAVVANTLADEITWKKDKDGKEWAELTLKVSKGFEFASKAKEVKINGTAYPSVTEVDEDEITITLKKDGIAASTDEFVITGLKVEATTAKAGDVATIKVGLDDVDSVEVEVATVVEEGLLISVDEDEDVPKIWSGVNSENEGLTSDDDHMSLEVTIEEAFEGSYNDKDEIELTLPEGVYVTDVKFGTKDVKAVEGTIEKAFEAAYNEGDYEGFVFEKRAFEETEPGDGVIEMSFELELVADPGFVGDVVMEMLVDGESVGEVTIAKFNTPMVVEAQANDLIIDYRNTEVPTNIVVKETEAGLWAKGLTVGFELDEYIKFEDDLTYTVNEESDMEVDGEDKAAMFEVDEESDDEAAVVTISNISLYMSRNLPAGAYDLEMTKNTAIDAYVAEGIYAAEKHEKACKDDEFGKHDCDSIVYIDDVTDYSDVVKEGWVNIVTAGRDADDASFTTKVVVPVGEMYIVAGEQTVALDVPAYVSASGYTMLPVRAVAVALGILNNNVLWDQATKTVTILYGQRIITMTVGAKVINVNGSAIPASSSPEVVDGRTFLPMRDLATALGVTDITWDAATKTATLNGNK